MHITIAAIGKMASGPEHDLVEQYCRRIRAQGRQCGVRGISIKELAEARGTDVAERRKAEGRRMLEALPVNARIIALDPSGRSLSSDALATQLTRWRSDNVADIVFLIGGPDGHGEDVLSASHLRLSLGAMTWPHRLARVMLAEQLYRCVTILTNHPYHRE